MRGRNTMGCLLTVSLIIAGAAGQDNDPNHGVVFIYPTKDQIYNLMDTVNVTYTSPFPTPNLYTFCDGGNRQVSIQRASGYNATVPIMLNFTSATPCWFNLRPGTQPGFGANSAVFTIIGQERGSGSRVFGPSETPTITPPPFTTGSGTKPTQTAGSDPAQSGSGSGGSSVSAGAGNDPSTGSSNSSNSTEGQGGTGSLSGGASAGIGVGVAVGILALAGGIFFWWWRRRSQGGPDANMMNGGGPRYGEEMKQEHGDYKHYGAAGIPPSTSAYTNSNSHTPSNSGHSPAPVYRELSAANGPAEIASSTTGTTQYRPTNYEMAAERF